MATRALREAAAGASLMEAVVQPAAAMVGRTVRDLEIRSRYGLNVLAVARQGERILTRLVDTTFLPGDILLVQGPEEGAVRFFRRHDCLPLAARAMRLGRTGSARAALAIFAGSVALAAVLGVAVQISFALGAFLMIVTGQLSLRQAYESLELPVLVLLACMLPVGHAPGDLGGSPPGGRRPPLGRLRPPPVRPPRAPDLRHGHVGELHEQQGRGRADGSRGPRTGPGPPGQSGQLPDGGPPSGPSWSS